MAPYLRSDIYYDGMFADTVKSGWEGCGVIINWLMGSKDGFQPELEEGIWVTEKVLEDGSNLPLSVVN
ncbi:MAG: hypothetical protein ACLU4J_02350 [Butyricimonas paravirosa]